MLRVHMFNYTNCKHLVLEKLFYFFVPAGVLDLPFSFPSFLCTTYLYLVLFQHERLTAISFGIANQVSLRKTEKGGTETRKNKFTEDLQLLPVRPIPPLQHA